jgi:hypothetical protein
VGTCFRDSGHPTLSCCERPEREVSRQASMMAGTVPMSAIHGCSTRVPSSIDCRESRVIESPVTQIRSASPPGR